MNKKDPTGRLARWSLFLQPFNLSIKYRPGKCNQNADSLSRAPVNAITVQSIMVDDWVTAQKEDTFCQQILKDLEKATSQTEQGGPQLRDITSDDNFQILPNNLLANASGKIVVPAKLQKEIMIRYHDHKLAGHFGVTKTLSIIRAKYFWPKMIPQIQAHVRNCLLCAKRKAHTTCKAPMQPIPPSEYIWERIAMDIMGPLPESSRNYKYILVIMEYATKYVIATPMRDMTAATVMRKLIKHVILKEGISSVILTDRGPNFLSNDMKELSRQLGVKQVRTTAYHPQTDGLVENFNKTLTDMLTAHVHKEPINWDIHLDYCISCYNQSIHISTKESPFFLLKGRDPLEPTDLRPPMRYRLAQNENNIFSQQWHQAVELARANILIAQDKQKQNYDKNIRECIFEEGDQVLQKESHSQTGKFYMRWDGPFIIIKKLSNVNVVIRDPRNDASWTVHINRLRKWNGKNEAEKDEIENGNLPTENGKPTENEKATENEKPTANGFEKTTENEPTETTDETQIQHTNDSKTNETNNELRNENVDENDTLFTDETLTKTTSEMPTENSRQRESDATSLGLGLQGEQATEQAGIQVNDTVPPRAIASTPQPASAGTLPVAPARRGRGRPRKTDKQKEKSNDGPNAERQEKTDGKIAQPTRYSLRQSIKIPKKLTY